MLRDPPAARDPDDPGVAASHLGIVDCIARLPLDRAFSFAGHGTHPAHREVRLFVFRLSNKPSVPAGIRAFSVFRSTTRKAFERKAGLLNRPVPADDGRSRGRGLEMDAARARARSRVSVRWGAVHLARIFGPA